MRPLNYSRILPLILFSLLSFYSQAQVKIGGNPKENPHPSAVLELQSADKGVLFPRLTQLQMEAIKAPADALVVYNTDAKAVWIYSLEQQQWMPLLQPMYRAAATPADSSEWVYDSTTLRVFLRRVMSLEIPFTITWPEGNLFLRTRSILMAAIALRIYSIRVSIFSKAMHQPLSMILLH
ncbi:MAG: hypothetical protein IPG86_14375 [Chitinophagaceae bacterium]|nr:hypothetical protein [Chitinophagaceae bacterium]